MIIYEPQHDKMFSREWYEKSNQHLLIIYEPRHDKTNKMNVRPAKTQISLGIRPVWSASSLPHEETLGP